MATRCPMLDLDAEVSARSTVIAKMSAADWLSLAAAPIFALMALLTGTAGGVPDMLCSAAHGGSLFEGMVPMYMLMSVFHLAPWLRLIAKRRRGQKLAAG